jgi:hypothetical protein
VSSHEDCLLCIELLRTRRSYIDKAHEDIAQWREDIAEIESGERHTDYHETWKEAWSTRKEEGS